MTAPRLSAASLHLLETTLDSYEKLEVVRAVRDLKQLEPASLIERLQSDAGELAETIDALVAAQILRRTGNSVVLGARGGDPELVELMTIYAQDQVLVITTLSTLVVGRLRNMAANTFAEAFLIPKRRRPDDG